MRTGTIRGVMTDAAQEWVDQARQGNQQAVRHLVEAHARPLFGVCVLITRDATLAEDAVQEALYDAWRHLAGFDGRASFTTRLHRIAVNAALEQRRRDARHVHEAPAMLASVEVFVEILDLLAVDAPGPD